MNHGRRAMTDNIKLPPLAEGNVAHLIAAQAAEIERLQRELDELQQSFDLHWRASMRAIKRWQEAHPGSDLTWPDHADLVVWLLEQLDAAREAEGRSDE